MPHDALPTRVAMMRCAPPGRYATSLLVLVLVGAADSARSQETSTVDAPLPVERILLTPFVGDAFLSVYGAGDDMGSRLGTSLGLHAEEAPIRLFLGPSPDVRQVPIATRLTIRPGLGVEAFGRFGAAVRLPLVVQTPDETEGVVDLGDVPSFAIGAPELALRTGARFGRRDAWGLAAVGHVAIGLQGSPLTRGPTTLALLGVLDWRSGRAGVAANVGLRLQPERQVLDTTLASEVLGAIGLRYRLLEGSVPLDLGLTVQAHASAFEPFGRENARGVQVLFQVGSAPPGGVRVDVGAGGSRLLDQGGLGVPLLRGVARLEVETPLGGDPRDEGAVSRSDEPCPAAAGGTARCGDVASAIRRWRADGGDSEKGSGDAGVALGLGTDTWAATTLLASEFHFGVAAEGERLWWDVTAGAAHLFERLGYGFSLGSDLGIRLRPGGRWSLGIGARFLNLTGFYDSDPGEPALHVLGRVGPAVDIGPARGTRLRVQLFVGAGAERRLVSRFEGAREVVDNLVRPSVGGGLGLAVWFR